MADMRDESHPIHILPGSTGHNMNYTISIKIRKHYSSIKEEKKREKMTSVHLDSHEYRLFIIIVTVVRLS